MCSTVILFPIPVRAEMTSKLTATGLLVLGSWKGLCRSEIKMECHISLSSLGLQSKTCLLTILPKIDKLADERIHFNQSSHGDWTDLKLLRN